jgi:membrane dipeptidase
MMAMQTDHASAPGRYDFGLSAAEEARAAALHRQGIIFDWLSQHVGGSNIFEHYSPELQAEFRAMVADAGDLWLAYRRAAYWPYEMSLQGRSNLIRDWYLASGMTCGTWGVPVHDGTVPQLLEAEAIKAKYENLPWLCFATTASQVREAKRDGLIAVYGHWQPTVPIPRDLKAIDRAYARGLRSLMLTYNRMDNVGVGCTERVDAGLSMYGVDVVRHCESIGLMVDASHCGHLTTLDACRQARRPVNANHTCAKSLSNVARGKSDDALRAIADTGGIIGVVAVPFFISTAPKPTIEAMLDHIDYITNLVGWKHVCLGTDWPNQAPDDVQQKLLGIIQGEIGFRPEDRFDVTARVTGFDDYRDLPNITRGLVKRGYSDEQIKGVLGENALRVFEDICG